VRLRELFAPAAGKTVLRSESFALALIFALTAHVAHADVSPGQGEGAPDVFAEATARRKPRDPVHVSVKLQGNTTCIDHGRLRDEIERALERPVFVDEHFDLVLDLRVTQASAAPGYVATLRLSDERGHPLGERRIESHDSACSLLFERVALAVTLMVDLRHDELEKVAPSPAKAPEEPPAAEPPARDTTPATSAPAPAFELDSVRLGALATWGLFPDLTWGVLLSPRVRVVGVPFELRGAFWPRRSFLAEGELFDLEALSFGAAFCPTLLERQLLERDAAIEVCAEIDALRALARGKSLDHNAEATLWSAAPGASLAGVWKVLPPLAVRVAAGARALSPRGKFVIVDQTGSDVTLYEASPVLGTIELGLVLEL
jgi:hypothetical protein